MIPILYEEPHFLVVNKPAGVLTQAVPGIDSIQVRLVEQLRVRDQHTGRPFVGLPHRLDRGTTGTLLIARNQRALKRFGKQFQHRIVQKFYVAWVHGNLQGPSQIWQDYVRKIENQPQAEIVPAETAGARLAELRVWRIAGNDEHSLVLIQLFTGRMHQIRLQLSSRKFPIVGDRLYGSEQAFAEDSYHALHALRIEFRHPTTAIPIGVTAPFPSSWQQAPEAIWSGCERILQQGLDQSHSPWDTNSLDL